MKTFAAILILIANLWNLTHDSSLRSLFDADANDGGATTMQEPPGGEGDPLIIPPPR